MADWSMMFGEALKKVIAPKRQPSLFYCLFIKIYSQRLRVSSSRKHILLFAKDGN
ncbi:hypothetical protein KIN20_037376 [Parelaphostrongylus tenuis]|uniref:Uncharacterized protein n=1 Tax=Parelaphostrongylus tenuis TaxID=148309 RepID=A0AAD5WL45_PARTN|nr:hypothetical protein KIN20_037376 [Parelaphostrongylus tenuis]